MQRYRNLSRPKRVLIWAVSTALTGVILFPWSSVVGPENNVIAGPMWLLRQTAPDFPVGLVLTAVLLPCALLFLLRPDIVGLLISLLAASAWVAIGVYLAMIAVV